MTPTIAQLVCAPARRGRDGQAGGHSISAGSTVGTGWCFGDSSLTNKSSLHRADSNPARIPKEVTAMSSINVDVCYCVNYY